jgi:hypothetical protein
MVPTPVTQKSARRGLFGQDLQKECGDDHKEAGHWQVRVTIGVRLAGKMKGKRRHQRKDKERRSERHQFLFAPVDGINKRAGDGKNRGIQREAQGILKDVGGIAGHESDRQKDLADVKNECVEKEA